MDHARRRVVFGVRFFGARCGPSGILGNRFRVDIRFVPVVPVEDAREAGELDRELLAVDGTYDLGIAHRLDGAHRLTRAADRVLEPTPRPLQDHRRYTDSPA